VMVGREAYHHPWSMAAWDRRFFDDEAPLLDRRAVEDAMVGYMEREAAAHATPWPSIARHMMGLWNGTPGARRWRQVWSDHRLKDLAPREVERRAHAAMRDAAAASTA
jgi:tRNA-dihydrouridine synthase A